jgi:hypothetical protein
LVRFVDLANLGASSLDHVEVWIELSGIDANGDFDARYNDGALAGVEPALTWLASRDGRDLLDELAADAADAWESAVATYDDHAEHGHTHWCNHCGVVRSRMRGTP